MVHPRVLELAEVLELAKNKAKRAHSLANKTDRLDAILKQLNRKENYPNEVVMFLGDNIQIPEAAREQIGDVLLGIIKKEHDATLLELEKL